MKHTFTVTSMLVLLFLVAQILGLYIVEQKIDRQATIETGVPVFESTPGVETPELPRENIGEVVFLFASAILIGTGLVLLIIKFRKKNLWKFWFLASVVVCLYSAFYLILKNFIGDDLVVTLSVIFAVTFGILKVFKQNVYVHNFTELFIYGGLAAIFIPIINITSATILLLLISGYDFFAVWQSKHMVKMAKFQTQSNLFAGMSIQYKRNPKEFDTKEIVEIYSTPKKKQIKKKTEEKKVSNAILGGGDIAFPLIFSSAIMIDFGYWKALVVVAFATISLSLLFILAKQDKFYPAMPFLSAGCLVGYGVMLLL